MVFYLKCYLGIGFFLGCWILVFLFPNYKMLPGHGVFWSVRFLGFLCKMSPVYGVLFKTLPAHWVFWSVFFAFYLKCHLGMGSVVTKSSRERQIISPRTWTRLGGHPGEPFEAKEKKNHSPVRANPRSRELFEAKDVVFEIPSGHSNPNVRGPFEARD